MTVTRSFLLPTVLALAVLPFSACGDSDPAAEADNTSNASAGQDTTDAPDPDPSTGTDSGGDAPDDEPGGDIDCSQLKTTGTEIGQVPPTVPLKDAQGNDVDLRDYCNSIVYVIAGTAG